MEPSPSETIHVSEIDYPLPWWRYLMVIQSWAQLRSVLFTIGIPALILLNIDDSLFDGRAPALWILLGCVGGATPALLMFLPVRFQVSPASAASLGRLHREIVKLRYVELEGARSTIVYRQDVLRIFRWDEGNLSAQRTPETIIVSGPQFALKALRKSLLREAHG